MADDFRRSRRANGVTVQVGLLTEHRDAIGVLAAWFIAQWPSYYAKRARRDVEKEFEAGMNTDRLPVVLLAHEAGTPLGTITLRERAMTDLPQYGPGLGAFYVSPNHRHRGIGTALVEAGMRTARQIGCAELYATTAAPGRIFERLGWTTLGPLLHRGEAINLYRCLVNVSAP